MKKTVSAYGIDTQSLIYDASNFFTYIDTLNPSDLAKRGHDKAKRNDLRTVSLALMVIPEFAIPMLSAAYPGNRNDSMQFSEMIKLLKERYENLTGSTAEITVVFDCGNNSENNLDLLESEGLQLHYVGGLEKSQRGNQKRKEAHP